MMNNRNIVLAVALVLALVTMACGANVKLPVTQIETIPTQTVDIQIPMPKESSAGVELNLEFVAGKLNLSPGASEYLASGTATFNVAEFEPNIDSSGSSHTVRSADLDVEGIPKFEEDMINEWDLQLADTPMTLNIKAGAYTGRFDLGGLSIEKLTISDGGSDSIGTFSEPNHVDMSAFLYSTGASKAELKGLANANFEQMIFNSGAGDYTLRFDGDLQRDASVSIDTGVSTVTIIVPEGINAKVTFEGGLTGVNIAGGWKQEGKVYTLAGDGPSLSFTVKMGAGTLNLQTE